MTGRFNERFILSLANCPSCIFMDDELNILPLSTHVRTLAPVPPGTEADPDGSGGVELRELRSTLQDVQPAGSLLECCRSLDQARLGWQGMRLSTLLTCPAVGQSGDHIHGRHQREDAALHGGAHRRPRSRQGALSTTSCMCCSARAYVSFPCDRSQSAALGIAIAGAISVGYANIFVTSPSPENLRTLFEFVFKGLDALGYKEHIDYDLVESTNPAFGALPRRTTHACVHIFS